MNILIYGDNSAAGKNLIPGFEGLGYTVDYVSNTDPRRGYDIDIAIRSGKSKIVRRTSGIINSILLPLKLKKKYDMIIMVNPFIGPFLLSDWIFKMLRDRTENLFWWITTCDSKMRLWSKENNATLCQRCNVERNTLDECPKFNEIGIEFDRRAEVYVDEVIPCSFEYAAGHVSAKKDIKIIPLSTSILPNHSSCIDSGNAKQNKILFYHGAQSIFKGSDVIKEAFCYGEKRWGNKADFDIGSFIKLENYILYILNKDVIVDQLYNMSFGVNSLLIMQSGRLLLAGDTDNYEVFNSQPPAPVVRLNGKYDNLTEKIDDIMSNWNYYSEMRAEGPAYVQKYHSPLVIAQQFVEKIKS